MARVNIHLPEDLAKRAREAGLNVSGIAQEALETELRIRDLDAWLVRVRNAARPATTLSHEDMMQIMDEVREESGRAADKYLGEPDRTYP